MKKIFDTGREIDLIDYTETLEIIEQEYKESCESRLFEELLNLCKKMHVEMKEQIQYIVKLENKNVNEKT